MGAKLRIQRDASYVRLCLPATMAATTCGPRRRHAGAEWLRQRRRLCPCEPNKADLEGRARTASRSGTSQCLANGAGAEPLQPDAAAAHLCQD